VSSFCRAVHMGPGFSLACRPWQALCKHVCSATMLEQIAFMRHLSIWIVCTAAAEGLVGSSCRLSVGAKIVLHTCNNVSCVACEECMRRDHSQ
jgi:hypothetical protein